MGDKARLRGSGQEWEAGTQGQERTKIQRQEYRQGQRERDWERHLEAEILSLIVLSNAEAQ